MISDFGLEYLIHSRLVNYSSLAKQETLGMPGRLVNFLNLEYIIQATDRSINKMWSSHWPKMFKYNVWSMIVLLLSSAWLRDDRLKARLKNENANNFKKATEQRHQCSNIAGETQSTGLVQANP